MRRVTGDPWAGTPTGTHGGRDGEERVTFDERHATQTLADAQRKQPARGLVGRDHDQDRNMVARAVMSAPSLHNAQPWLLRVRPDRVELYRDTSRALPLIDPHGREATISCGAALFGIRLAVAMQGHQAVVPLLPDPDTPSHLATVLAGPPYEASAEEEHLFEVMPRRRWHPGPFVPREVPDHVTAELETAVRAEDAWVRDVRSTAQREALTGLTNRAAEVLARGRAYRDEVATWNRRVPVGRGVPGVRRDGAAEHPPAPGLWRTRLVRPDTVDGDPHRDLLLVVGARSDDPRGWLAAGQALHRLLLAATARGLVASTLTQVVEVPRLREALASALRLPGAPQFVVRVGYPTSEVPSPPVRSAADVVLG